MSSQRKFTFAISSPDEFLVVFLFYTAYLLYYYEHGGVDLMGLKPNP